MKIEKTKLAGVVIITPRVFEDPRGFFMETFNARDAGAAGLPVEYVQDNHSRSCHAVLRGLHYQYPQWQGKLIRVVSGEIYDVAVDIRPHSATRGQWVGIYLSSDNKRQIYVPEGFAHGFCVTSDAADVVYKCTTMYEPSQDRCISWNDPDIGIEWPLQETLVSEKDARGTPLREHVLA